MAIATMLECVVCGSEHVETPPVRDDLTYDARDWTYYRDYYGDEGYAVICKRIHDKELAPDLPPIKQKGMGL